MKPTTVNLPDAIASQLTARELELLPHIVSLGRVKTPEAANILGITSSAVLPHLANLVRKGFIKRTNGNTKGLRKNLGECYQFAPTDKVIVAVSRTSTVTRSSTTTRTPTEPPKAKQTPTPAPQPAYVPVASLSDITAVIEVVDRICTKAGASGKTRLERVKNLEAGLNVLIGR